MKTTDYGFWRIALCGPAIWKETLFGTVIVWTLLQVLLMIACLAWAALDMIGADVTPFSASRVLSAGLATVGISFLLALIAEMNTVTVWVAGETLRFQYHRKRNRPSPIEEYQLCDLLSADRGFSLCGSTGIIIRYEDISSPLCFVLNDAQAVQTLQLIHDAVAAKSVDDDREDPSGSRRHSSTSARRKVLSIESV